MAKFMPSRNDFGKLKEHMATIVSRSAVLFMDGLSELEDAVVQHIPHEYSKQSSEKSKMVIIEMSAICYIPNILFNWGASRCQK